MHGHHDGVLDLLQRPLRRHGPQERRDPGIGVAMPARGTAAGPCDDPGPEDRQAEIKKPPSFPDGGFPSSPVLLLLLFFLLGGSRALGGSGGSGALGRSRSALGARGGRARGGSRAGRRGSACRRRRGAFGRRLFLLLLRLRHDVADLRKVEDRLAFLPALLLLQELEALGPRQDVAMTPEVSGGDETFVDGHK